jgi:beta-glucosidase
MATGQPGTSPAGAIGGTPAIPGLCIPALSEEDGPIGVGDGLTGVTQLPAAGIQSQDVISEVKHFAVYNQETNRNSPQDDAIISNRTMHEIYLPGFYSATIKGGAGAVMCGYSVVNGQYDCQNSYLLNTLNQRWGYPGFVSSDYGGTHATAASAQRGAGPGDAVGGLLRAGAAGRRAGRPGIHGHAERHGGRILTEMFRFGFFNHPPTGNSKTVVTDQAHADLARTDAVQGTVLLKNDGGALRLSSGTSSIAVIGADGTTGPMSAGGGSAGVTAPYVVSPLQGIQSRAGSGVTVTSYAGTDPAQAAATAKAAQVAIVFADNFETEGADLSGISLQDNQDAYIAAVAAANPDTIVVLNTGGPAGLPAGGRKRDRD